MQNARYNVGVTAYAGAEVATGRATLTTQVPWGVDPSEGGVGLGVAATFAPVPIGEPAIACASSTPCRITGPGTLRRGMPFLCYAESVGHAGCDQFKGQNGGLMPDTSSFRAKIERHESTHVAQFNFGRLNGDLYGIEDGSFPLMSFAPPGGPPLGQLTAPTQGELEQAFRNYLILWIRASGDQQRERSGAAESEAWQAADGVPPQYLFQMCHCGSQCQ